MGGHLLLSQQETGHAQIEEESRVREGEFATWRDLASGERVGASAEQEPVVTSQNRCALGGGGCKSDGCMN